MTTLIGSAASVREAAGIIGRDPVDGLAPARLAMHFALQPVAAVGFTFVTARDDYRHTVQRWDRTRRAFVGLPTPDGIAAVLDPIAATLALDDDDDRFALPGHTLDDAYAWLATAIARRRGDDPRALVRPAHALPEHPLAHGDAFPRWSDASAAELAAWFELADAVLAAVTAAVPDATPHCIWPHRPRSPS